MKKALKPLINCIPNKRLRHKLRNRFFLSKYKTLNKRIPGQIVPKKLTFLYTTNTSNIGDLASSSLHYFDFGATNVSVDIVQTLNNNMMENPVIIGGGIHPWLFSNMEFARRLYPHGNIAWGIGTFFKEKYPANILSKFALIGLRESNSPMIDHQTIFHCPCSSCMSSLFDIQKRPSEEIVFYLHKMFTPTDFFNKVALKYPVMDNYNKSFYEVIQFLQTGKIVVTNSYHGMYWATLLGKKVVCIDIHNKCHGTQWLPQFTDYDNWESALSETKIYENALSEARSLNRDFYNKVIEILGNKPVNK